MHMHMQVLPEVARKHVQTLDLASNKLGPEAAAALCRALAAHPAHARSVTKLVLFNNKIGMHV